MTNATNGAFFAGFIIASYLVTESLPSMIDPTGIGLYLIFVLATGAHRMGLYARDMATRALVSSTMSNAGATVLVRKIFEDPRNRVSVKSPRAGRQSTEGGNIKRGTHCRSPESTDHGGVRSAQEIPFDTELGTPRGQMTSPSTGHQDKSAKGLFRGVPRASTAEGPSRRNDIETLRAGGISDRKSQGPSSRLGGANKREGNGSERTWFSPSQRRGLADEFVFREAMDDLAVTREAAIMDAVQLGQREIPRPRVIPHMGHTVTVIFSDIVGFTSLVQNEHPATVFSLMNEYFSKLDLLLPEFGIFKYQTIGDAYVAVANYDGTQTLEESSRNALEFARAMVCVAASVKIPTVGSRLAAIEAKDSVPEADPSTSLGADGLSSQHRGAISSTQTAAWDLVCDHAPSLEIRVGLHSGPIVGSVLGSERPALTLLGDTLNTGSRMESLSRPGHVRLSAATFDLLPMTMRHSPALKRDDLEVKGKGTMTTFIADCTDTSSWVQLFAPPLPDRTSHYRIPTSVHRTDN